LAKIALKLKTTLAPVPTLLVSCTDLSGRHNIITISYAGIVNTTPPIINISIKPSRYSWGLIKATGDFVINIPGENLLRETDYCGVASGQDVDKFALTGLTPLPSSLVKSPLIKECPVNLECVTSQIVTCGNYDLFIAEVVAVHADEEFLDAGRRLDIDRVKPIAFCYDAMQYWSLKANMGKYGYTKGKIQLALLHGQSQSKCNQNCS
jgi:flavin reductase (DIM6/NTAB) family NADH-FMN oxidoreductase RutF